MKPHIYAILALSAGSIASAQEVGRVISSTPVIRQAAVPQQVCQQESVLVERQHGGGGALIGAIAGGAIGNSIGQGGGRALGTLIGIIGGAAVGDRIENHGAVNQVQQVQRCTTHMSFYSAVEYVPYVAPIFIGPQLRFGYRNYVVVPPLRSGHGHGRHGGGYGSYWR